MTHDSAISKSLADIAGIPVSLAEDGALDFGPGVIQPTVEHRTVDDAAPVLLYPGEPGPKVLYTMYRGLGLAQDGRALENLGLRYDITVLSPGKVGSEYVKTVGHYHPRVPGQVWTYPEVYQVLSGVAHFLLQKGGEMSGEVEDFAVAWFEAGDILLIPPFYGHVTVNPGQDHLVMANFIARDFQSVYDPVRLRKGLAFYDVEHKGQSIFMPNESYARHPKPRLETPRDYPEFGLTRGESMYKAWQSGADLAFLRKPSLLADLWESMGCSAGN